MVVSVCMCLVCMCVGYVCGLWVGVWGVCFSCVGGCLCSGAGTSAQCDLTAFHIVGVYARGARVREWVLSEGLLGPERILGLLFRWSPGGGGGSAGAWLFGRFTSIRSSTRRTTTANALAVRANLLRPVHVLPPPISPCGGALFPRGLGNRLPGLPLLTIVRGGQPGGSIRRASMVLW